MSYVVLENFRQGLDTRRSVLTSQLGSLVTLRNAFVNQGGEIEKRKAFVPVSIAPGGSGVSATYGIEALSDKIAIFGGDANATPGSWPTEPFAYYRLFLDTTTFDYIPTVNGAAVKATAVVFSTVFGGTPFVIATMSNGWTVCFYGATLVSGRTYNMTPVKDSFMGLATRTGLAGQTDMTIAQYLKMLRVALDDSVVYDGGPDTPTTLLTTTTAKGGRFSQAITDTGSFFNTSTQPTRTVSTDVSETVAVSPVASFQITGGSASAGVNKVSSVKVYAADLLSSVTITDGTTGLDWATSNETTAAGVAANIAAYSGTSGYTATSSGTTVLVSTTAGGTSANGKVLEVTTAGDVTTTRFSLDISGTAFTMDYLRVNGADLLNGTPAVYAAPSSLATYVASLATTIRANAVTSAGSIWNAVAVGKSLLLSKLVTRCTDAPVEVDVSITPTAATDTGYVELTTPKKMVVSLSPTSQVFALPAGYSQTTPYLESDVVVGTVENGTPPFTYQWFYELPTDSGVIVKLSAITAPSTTLIYSRAGVNTEVKSGVGKLYLTVTDFDGISATSPAMTFSFFVQPGGAVGYGGASGSLNVKIN